jgi:hypothetical protein
VSTGEARSAEEPRTKTAGAGWPLVAAIIAASCGALLTNALDGSANLRLAGAVLGATIPVVATQAGPAMRLRTGLAILFTLFAYATDRPSTFPIPPSAPDPAGSGGDSGGDGPSGPGIAVEPNSVRCDPDGCDDDSITIESTGSEPLRITRVEFDGEGANEFTEGHECDGAELVRGDDCTLTLTFVPADAAGTRAARLVIHQNLPGPPTYVQLEATSDGNTTPSTTTNLVASADGLRCVFQHGGALVNGQPVDALQIWLSLKLEGADPGDLPGLPLVSAKSDQGPSVRFNSAIGEGVVAALPVGTGDLGKTHDVTITVDPENSVAEEKEDDNTLEVAAVLPANPQPTQELPCSVT